MKDTAHQSKFSPWIATALLLTGVGGYAAYKFGMLAATQAVLPFAATAVAAVFLMNYLDNRANNKTVLESVGDAAVMTGLGAAAIHVPLAMYGWLPAVTNSASIIFPAIALTTGYLVGKSVSKCSEKTKKYFDIAAGLCAASGAAFIGATIAYPALMIGIIGAATLPGLASIVAVLFLGTASVGYVGARIAASGNPSPAPK